MLASPRTETVDPIREKLLRDKDAPTCGKDSTDREEPKLITPSKAIELPIRENLRRDNDDAT
jgi:hypothetical protein